MSNPRELALVAHCLYCKTLFTQVVDTVSLQQFSGQKGKGILEDYYVKLQKKYYAPNSSILQMDANDLTLQRRDEKQNTHSSQNEMDKAHFSQSERKKSHSHHNKEKYSSKGSKRKSVNNTKEDHMTLPSRFTYLTCPTCVECCHIGSVHTTIVETFGPEAYFPLSLCEWFKFHADDEPDLSEDESGPPIYINMNPNNSGKPKWELCHGIGAPRLELDSSRSGRLRKNVLRQYNLSHLNYHQYVPNPDIGSDNYRYMIDTIFDCINFRWTRAEHAVQPKLEDYMEIEGDPSLLEGGSEDDVWEIINILRELSCIFEEYSTFVSIFEQDAQQWKMLWEKRMQNVA